MPKLSVAAGSVSQTLNVFLQDNSKVTGVGLTGLVFNTATLTAYYCFPRGGSTSITLATLGSATASWSSGGFKEIDATNMPGLYRFDPPNAMQASGNGRFVDLYFQGNASINLAPLPLEVELTGWDNQNAINGGMSGIPSVTINGGQNAFNFDNAGNINADLSKINNTTFTFAGPYVGSSNSFTFNGAYLQVDMEQLHAQSVFATGSVTFPAGLVASTTNITAGTIATVANAIVLPNMPASWLTSIWQDTMAGDFTVSTSPGKIIFSQLGGAFTTTSSSVFSTAALANGPSGSGPTAAQIATAVWQDAAAGDMSVTSSIGKALYIAVAPGASGGHMISGSNSGTTTFGALTVTGATTLTGAWVAINGSNNVTGVATSLGNTDLQNITTYVWTSTSPSLFTVVGSAGRTLKIGVPEVAYGTNCGLPLSVDSSGNVNALTVVGDVAGRVLGNSTTPFSDVGVQADTRQFLGQAVQLDSSNFPYVDTVRFQDNQLSCDTSGNLYVNVKWWIDDPVTTNAGLPSVDATSVGGSPAVPQTGDAYAIVNNGTYGNSALHTQIAAVQTTANGISVAVSSTGVVLTSAYDAAKAAAPASTALSTATWTGTLATNLGTLAGHDPGDTLASRTNITAGTISALAANAITTASIQDGALTDAKITVPSVTTGPASGILAMIQQTWRRFFHRTHEDKVGLTITTYANDNTTVLTTQNYTTSSTADDVGTAS